MVYEGNTAHSILWVAMTLGVNIIAPKQRSNQLQNSQHSPEKTKEIGKPEPAKCQRSGAAW